MSRRTLLGFALLTLAIVFSAGELRANSPRDSARAATQATVLGSPRSALASAAAGSGIRRAHAAARRDCFAHPKACGYPDPHAVYPSPAAVGPNNGRKSVSCSSLKRVGTLTITEAGRKVTDLNVEGRIIVDAPDVTIQDVCVTDNAEGNINNPPAVQFNATGGTIDHSDISGANTTSKSVEIALGEDTDSGYTLSARHDYLYRCGECVHNDGWTLKDSYVITNGDPCGGGYSGSTCEGTPDHREDIYCDEGGFKAIHDTLLDPTDETAALFCNVNNGAGGTCVNRVTLTHSLLAGGSALIYTCSNASSVGSSHMDIADNRFARCGVKATYQPSTGGYTCGARNTASRNGKGYWPYGGYFYVKSYTYCPGQGGGTWTDNIWDDTGAVVPC